MSNDKYIEPMKGGMKSPEGAMGTVQSSAFHKEMFFGKTGQDAEVQAGVVRDSVFVKELHNGKSGADAETLAMIAQSHKKQEITAQNLSTSGVLPGLLLSQFNRLDGDGSGNLSHQELARIADSKTADPILGLTANHAINNFEEIRRSAGWFERQTHSSDTLSQAEVAAYAAQHQELPLISPKASLR